MSDYSMGEMNLDKYIYKLSTKDECLQPLWRPAYDDEEGYYEIQVYVGKKDEAAREKSIDQILNMNKYLCPVCNVIVPKSYMKEHNKSVKHITCLAICNTAMDRAKKYMALEIVAPKKIEVEDTYFCDPCACVVLNSDKDHEKSAYHEISVKHDEDLKELLELYMDRNNIKLKGNRESETAVCKTESTDKDLISDDTEIDDDLNEVDYEDIFDFDEVDSDQADKKVTMKSHTSKDDEISTPEALNTKKSYMTNVKNATINANRSLKVTAYNLKEYLSALAESYEKSTHALTALPGGLVKIKPLNGDTFILPFYNFFGYVKSTGKRKKIYCKVCTQAGIKDNGQHEWSPEHMDKVMTPIHDGHGLREVDDVWTHCLLCNELIKNTELHIKMTIHSNNFINYLETKPKPQPQSTVKEEDGEEGINIDNVTYRSSITECVCAICDGTFPSKDTHVAHLYTTDHIKNFADFIEINKINEMSENLLHCEPCDVTILKNLVHSHCIGKRHRKKLKKANNIHAPSNETVNYHMSQKKSNSTIKDVTQSKLTKVTEVAVPLSKPTAISDSAVNKPCEIDAVNDITEKQNLFKQFLQMNGLREIHFRVYSCDTCDASEIPLWSLPFHCVGPQHTEMLKKKAAENDITEICNGKSSGAIDINTRATEIATTELLDNVTYASKAKCTGIVEMKSSATQIATSQAQDNKAETSNDTSKTQAGTTPTAKVEEYVKIIYQYKKSTDINELICVICKVPVSRKNNMPEQHIMGKKHVQMFNNFMSLNKMYRKTDRYFCGVCEVDVSYFNEIMHIFANRHSSKMSTNLPECTPADFNCVALTHDFVMTLTKRKQVDNPSDSVKTNNCKIATTEPLHKTDTSKTKSSGIVEMKTSATQNAIKPLEDIAGTSNGGLKIEATTPETSKVEEYLKITYQFKKTSTENILICKLCKVPLKRAYTNYHVHAKKHANMFNNFMSLNKMYRKNNAYFCGVCQVGVTYFNEIDHILGKLHVSKLSANTNCTPPDADCLALTHDFVMTLNKRK